MKLVEWILKLVNPPIPPSVKPRSRVEVKNDVKPDTKSGSSPSSRANDTTVPSWIINRQPLPETETRRSSRMSLIDAI